MEDADGSWSSGLAALEEQYVPFKPSPFTPYPITPGPEETVNGCDTAATPEPVVASKVAGPGLPLARADGPRQQEQTSPATPPLTEG